MTRAGSGFSGSFVSGFPTARLGFTLRRGHEATEHLSSKGTWVTVPPFLGLVCLSIDGWSSGRRSGSRLPLRRQWGPCGHGWLSGAYTMGTLSYGEEEFNSNSACST